MKLAHRVASRLATVPGVDAVVLGGSRASGRADAGSDLDLGIYYAAGVPPDHEALERVASALDDRARAEIARPGEWGPWVNGGGWLVVDDVKVDWILRDLGRVDDVFDACIAGRVSCDYYLGHPHGFHNHYYLAEVHHCEPLHDPSGRIARLKSRLSPYPRALRQAIVDKYLYDAAFTLDLARSSAARGDVLHVSGCLFRCAAALVQVVFAANERFTMNEKRSLDATRELSRAPRGFAARTERLLAAPGGDAPALAASLDEMQRLIDETTRIAPPVAYAWRGTRGETDGR